MASNRLTHLAARLSNLDPGVQDTITLYSQNVGVNQGTYTQYAVQRPRRRMKNRDQFLNDLMGANQTIIWEMWVDLLAADGVPAPKPSDQIVDACGVKYIIQSVTFALNRQLHSCECQEGSGQ